MTIDIKICGLKTEAAIAASLDGGASHIGFIFFEKSPRHISVDLAARLRKAAKNRAKAVAVTVNASDDELDAIVSGMKPDMLQLHGHETPERIIELKARYGLAIIKALSVQTRQDLLAIQPFLGIADVFLLDAKPPADADLPGGNGITFDWSILSSLDADIDYMLSGGLNAENIATALSAARPTGLDISSGVEKRPGEKDPARIHTFFQAVNTALNSGCKTADTNEERNEHAG